MDPELDPDLVPDPDPTLNSRPRKLLFFSTGYPISYKLFARHYCYCLPYRYLFIILDLSFFPVLDFFTSGQLVDQNDGSRPGCGSLTHNNGSGSGSKQKNPLFLNSSCKHKALSLCTKI